VRILLKAGASVSDTDKMKSRDDGGGQTALHYAAGQRNIAVVEELLNAGADSNALTISVHKPGYTPLICAIRAGQREVMHLLIQRGANMGSKIGGNPAYSVLCAVLEARGCQAAATRDLFLQLLESGADPNGLSNFKRTPLFRVLEKSMSLDIQPTDLPDPIVNLLVKKLLKAGADPDWLDDARSVPLHTAALGYQRVGAVKLLLEAGVDINRIINPKATVLDYIGEKIGQIKGVLRGLSGTVPTDEKMAERTRETHAFLEDKLRRCTEIEKLLRQFGAKRKSELSRAK
jgi:ankyrin repeat protein